MKSLAQAQLRESTTVEVVEVPVNVEDHGTPVTSLTRQNFALFVNGKAQAIDYATHRHAGDRVSVVNRSGKSRTLAGRVGLSMP